MEELLCSCCTNLHPATDFVKSPIPEHLPPAEFENAVNETPKYKTCAPCRARMARTRSNKSHPAPSAPQHQQPLQQNQLPSLHQLQLQQHHFPPHSQHQQAPNHSLHQTTPPEGPHNTSQPPTSRQCGTCRKTLSADMFVGDSPKRPVFKCCQKCRQARRNMRKQRRQRLTGSIDSTRKSSDYSEETLVEQETPYSPNKPPLVNQSMRNQVIESWPRGTVIRHYANYCITQYEKGYRWTPSFEQTFTNVRHQDDAIFPHWYRTQPDEQHVEWTPRKEYIESMFEAEQVERIRSGKDRVDPFGPTAVD